MCHRTALEISKAIVFACSHDISSFLKFKSAFLFDCVLQRPLLSRIAFWFFPARLDSLHHLPGDETPEQTGIGQSTAPVYNGHIQRLSPVLPRPGSSSRGGVGVACGRGTHCHRTRSGEHTADVEKGGVSSLGGPDDTARRLVSSSERMTPPRVFLSWFIHAGEEGLRKNVPPSSPETRHYCHVPFQSVHVLAFLLSMSSSCHCSRKD